MRISLNWLKEIIELKDSPEKISEILSSLGLEVEGMERIESIKGGLKGVIVGEVVECEKHPNADKLSLTKVNIGENKLLQIVCGAPNVAKGQKVLVATEGTTLHPLDGEAFTIKRGKIRGEESQGMICADDELGIGHDHSGIKILASDAVVGQAAADALNLESDIIFEIGLTPNRADATNHIGVAADLAAWYKVHQNEDLPIINTDKLNLNKTNQEVAKVILDDELKCPRYSGVCFTNIKVGPSPEWLQKKILAMDQKPVNNVVDITNLIMFETGQPLHAFDLDKVAGKTFWIKSLAEGTTFTTLDGVERKLRAEDLMICDGDGHPMCIAGVLGGKDSGVSDDTTSIFLESAHFQANTIRKSSTKHNIRSQAARSFEKGSDPNICVLALERAAFLLKDICGAEQSSALIDIYHNPINPSPIELDLQYVNKLSGLNLNKDTLSTVLLALKMTIQDHQNGKMTVFVPTNKPDVTRPADIVEEISRVYGLDNIPLPDKFTFAMPKANISGYTLRKKLSESLVAKGLNEIVNLSLTSSKTCLQTKLWDESSFIYIHNTSNSHLDIMKPNLVIGGLESIQYNANRQNTDLAFFEIAKEFYKKDEQIIETSKLGIWMTGLNNPNHWTSAKDKSTDFYSIKSVVLSIFTDLKIEKLKVNAEHPSAIFEYGLIWSQGPRKIAECGLLKSNLLKAYDLKKQVWYAEIELEFLKERLNQKAKKFEEYTKFPIVKRDLALVIDKKVAFDELKQIAISTCGKNLAEVNVFDVFEDEKKLGEGKKSYALNFSFESLDKSLVAEDIDHIMSKLIQNYESKVSAIIRR